MNLLDINTKQDALNFVNKEWDNASLDVREVVRRRLQKFPLSLSDRELLFSKTGEVSWLEIPAPRNFYFCGIMIEELPFESPNRREAIHMAMSMVPLHSRAHHTTRSVLDTLLLLYTTERNKRIFAEIQKYAQNCDDWMKVYEKTHCKWAIYRIFSFPMSTARLRELLRIVIPKHRKLLYERIGELAK